MNATVRTARPRTFAEAEAALAAHLPGYQARPHQQALASEIEQAIGARTILLAEAGTGTGKSIAGLVPAILWAVANRKRVVVATATRALQNQYAEKDLPFLEAYLGVPFKWAVIKGRSNYPCASRISDLQYPSASQEEVIKTVKTITAEDDFTDRDGLPTVTDREWQQLSITSAECPGAKDCPFAKAGYCFAQRAKAKAANAEIVITNMAYLAVDIKLRKETGGQVDLLGNFDLLIIDEAHNLDNAITGALTDRLAQGTFIKLARDAAAWLEKQGVASPDFEDDEDAVDDVVLAGGAGNVEAIAGDLWNQVFTAHVQWQNERRRDEMGPDVMPVTQQIRLAVFGPLMQSLFKALRTLNGDLHAIDLYARPEGFYGYDSDGEPLRKKLAQQQRKLIRRTLSLMGRLKDFATEEDDVTVRWVEEEKGRDGEPRLYLVAVPVSPAPFLAANVWSQVPSVLMSATLAPGRTGFGEADFSYTIESLGLDEFGPSTFESGTPFNYPDQALLYVPERTLPVPSGKTAQAWRTYAQDVTDHLVRASGGGALLLFTSRSAMEDAYRRLAPVFAESGLEVLKQGDEPTPVLIRKFKNDGNAVLFALRTFFEGIDIPGMALRLVILDKLPFPVPTDMLFAARCNAVNTRHGREVSFQKLSMPMMTLPLIQAMGRLLRTVTDRGVVAILDPRLTSKGYGAKILHSLPPARVTSDPRDAIAFLEDM